jgi:hypothetical protein
LESARALDANAETLDCRHALADAIRDCAAWAVVWTSVETLSRATMEVALTYAFPAAETDAAVEIKELATRMADVEAEIADPNEVALLWSVVMSETSV